MSGIFGGVRDALLEERDRWLLWVPVAFGAGIGLYFFLPNEPPVWLAFGLGALSITCGWLCRRRPGVMFLSVGLFIVAAGLLNAQWHTLRLKHPVLAENRSAASVQGRIVLLEPFPDGVRVTLDRIRIQNLAAPQQPPRVRVRLRGAQPALAAGDWIEVRAVFSPPPPPVLPGGFDLQRQFYFQELAGVGFALGRARIVQPHLEEWQLATAIERLRWRVTQRVVAAIPGDAGTVAAALITGQRTIVREPVLEAFRASGIAHLLAISGLHIGLVAGFIFVIVRGGLSLIPAIALPYPIKETANGRIPPFSFMTNHFTTKSHTLKDSGNLTTQPAWPSVPSSHKQVDSKMELLGILDELEIYAERENHNDYLGDLAKAKEALKNKYTGTHFPPAPWGAAICPECYAAKRFDESAVDQPKQVVLKRWVPFTMRGEQCVLYQCSYQQCSFVIPALCNEPEAAE